MHTHCTRSMHVMCCYYCKTCFRMLTLLMTLIYTFIDQIWNLEKLKRHKKLLC